MLILVALSLPTRAEEEPLVESTSTRFNYAHQLIRSADESRDKGDVTMAGILYGEALKEYDMLTRAYPNWDPAVSRFRADYCREQLAELRRQGHTAPTAATNTAADPPVAPAPPLPPAAPPDAFVPGAEPVADASPAPTVESLRQQASVLLREGRAQEARELLMQGMRLDPDDTATRLMVGVAQCALGQYQDALYVLEPLADEEPNLPAAALALGAAYFGLGDTAGAESAARRAIAADDTAAGGHYNLARVLIAVNPTNRIEAMAHYLKALDLGAAPDADLSAQLGITNAPAP